MARQRKTPDVATAMASEGFSNIKYNLYTQSQIRTQARLRRKYGLCNAAAILVADVLYRGDW